MKHVLFCIVLFQLLFSQPGYGGGGYHSPGTGVISGEVLNSKTGAPI